VRQHYIHRLGRFNPVAPAEPGRIARAAHAARRVSGACCSIQHPFRVVAFPGHHALCGALAAAWEGRRAVWVTCPPDLPRGSQTRWVRRPTAQESDPPGATRRGEGVSTPREILSAQAASRARAPGWHPC